MKFRLGRNFLMVLFFIIFVVNLTTAAGIQRQVLILDIPRFTFEDLGADTPWFRRFVEGGSIGIMTTPLVEPLTLEKVYLAFNSGTQLRINEESAQFYNAGEEYQGLKVGGLYRSLTGFHTPPGGIVNLGFPRLVQLNNNRAGVSNIGLVGKILHQHGLKTAVIGNADADLPNRDSALLIMDEQGFINYGDVGRETLRVDGEFPFGVRNDPERLYAKWSSLRSQAQVIVLSLGDLERIERFSVYLNPDLKQAYRREVMRNYDRFIEKILAADLKDTLVIVFSGLPPAPIKNSSNAKESPLTPTQLTPTRLTPVVIRGPGYGPGVLFSGSTRENGIVACYDLPVTIFHFLQLPKTDYPNRHYLISRPGNQDEVAEKSLELTQNHLIRWPLLTVYGYLLIGLVLFGVISMIYNLGPKVFRMIEYSYLFLLTIPAVFLIEALLNPVAWNAVILWTVGLAGFLFGVAMLLSKRDFFQALSIISLLTAGLIIGDGFFNGYLELYSFFGYSAVAGARFYGIGNEYLGFLLGALIVLISLNLENIGRYRQPILWLVTFGTALFLALPNLGANIGGGITALMGLGITTYLLLGHPIKLREILILGSGLVLLLIFIGCWELLISNQNITHFGQFLTLVRDHGIKGIGDLISRKLEMNGRLINYTPWTKVLIGILLVIPLIYKKPPAFIDAFIKKYPNRIHGFVGLTLTALIALMANDSGIVTVATIYIFGIMMLFLVIFQEWIHRKKGCA